MEKIKKILEKYYFFIFIIVIGGTVYFNKEHIDDKIDIFNYIFGEPVEANGMQIVLYLLGSEQYSRLLYLQEEKDDHYIFMAIEEETIDLKKFKVSKEEVEITDIPKEKDVYLVFSTKQDCTSSFVVKKEFGVKELKIQTKINKFINFNNNDLSKFKNKSCILKAE